MGRRRAGKRTSGASSVWGVPDWRDAKAYPTFNGLTPRQWWWEFTRRRPEYRALWIEKIETDPPKLSKEMRRQIAEALGNPALENLLLYVPFSVEDQCRLRIVMPEMLPPNLTFEDAILQSELRTTTRLDQRFDGQVLQQAQGLTSSQLAAKIEKYRRLDKLRERSGWVDVTYDLMRPLGPQSVEVLNELVQLQAKRSIISDRKQKREPWPNYLRVLDARDAWDTGDEQATFDGIAKVLWPHGKTHVNAQKLHERACKIRDNFPV